MYNEVSKELFGFGTTLLKVTVEQNVITLRPNIDVPRALKL